MNSKILLVGDPAVGKSSLLHGFIRCVEDQNKKKNNKLPSFEDSYNLTERIVLKSVTMDHIEGNKVELQIWDTVGIDCANIMTTSYFERAHGIMIV